MRKREAAVPRCVARHAENGGNHGEAVVQAEAGAEIRLDRPQIIPGEERRSQLRGRQPAHRRLAISENGRKQLRVVRVRVGGIILWIGPIGSELDADGFELQPPGIDRARAAGDQVQHRRARGTPDWERDCPRQCERPVADKVLIRLQTRAGENQLTFQARQRRLAPGSLAALRTGFCTGRGAMRLRSGSSRTSRQETPRISAGHRSRRRTSKAAPAGCGGDRLSRKRIQSGCPRCPASFPVSRSDQDDPSRRWRSRSARPSRRRGRRRRRLKAR